MKTNFHPPYYPEAKVTCTCGNTFTTGSTIPEIHLDICAACHPFFTGEMRLIDTQGRIEKFQAKMAKAAHYASTSKKKTKDKIKKERPTSLKEMLTQEKQQSSKLDKQ